MAAEPVENAWAGAAGVNERRRPAPSRHLDRIDAERGPTPVDMCVEIDRAREHPARVVDLDTASGKVAPDFAYLSVAEGDVGGLVDPARRIDDAPASEDQV